jgi:hypothetical protein
VGKAIIYGLLRPINIYLISHRASGRICLIIRELSQDQGTVSLVGNSVGSKELSHYKRTGSVVGNCLISGELSQ